MASNYEKIYTGNFIIIQKIVARLEEIGISAIVKDEGESGRLAGFMPPILGEQDVLVRLDEVDDALPVINQIISEMPA